MHHDQRTQCSITRIWTAVDVAGNVQRLTQLIVLEFHLTLSFLPAISISCDSSANPLLVPTNTATLGKSMWTTTEAYI